jgi:hypothetical protein
MNKELSGDPMEKFQLGIFCVNDGSKVDVKVPQVMYCTMCYNRLMVLVVS